jgi:hypothetical protein
MAPPECNIPLNMARVHQPSLLGGDDAVLDAVVDADVAVNDGGIDFIVSNDELI